MRFFFGQMAIGGRGEKIVGGFWEFLKQYEGFFFGIFGVILKYLDLFIGMIGFDKVGGL